VFLRFTNFYQQFIEQYSRITTPLTSLLIGSKNGKKMGLFEWPESMRVAFQRLQEAFMIAPILIHFDSELKIQVETDASDYAIAAILSQLVASGMWHLVAFWSRKIIPAKQNYKTHDQELLTIVAAFKQWRHYLDGVKHIIEVLTDHNNL